MNRPEGISPEAWEKAIEATNAIADEKPLGNRRAVIVARAIHSSVEAERERAAKVAEAYPFRRWEQSEPDKSVYGWGRCRTEIAAAIRKGA